MPITNEEAMQELQAAKARRAAHRDDAYWHGAFMGSAGAYLLADVITLDQYNQLTKPNHIVDVNKMVAEHTPA